MTDTDKTFVNGPVNAVRLEGEINGIHKVLYVFMDWHEDLTDQTECENIFSKDITRYLADNFSEMNAADKTYDFFLEINPTNIINEPNNRRAIYIVNTWKFFRRIFRISDRKVLVSDTFRNVRFHYIDIRDYVHDYFYFKLNALLSTIDHLPHNFGILEHIIKTLVEIKTDLDTTLDIMSTNVKPASVPTVIKSGPRPSVVIEPDVIRNLTYKLRSGYHHKPIGVVLVNILDTQIKQLTAVSQMIGTAIDRFDGYNKSINENRFKLRELRREPGYYLYGTDWYDYWEIYKDVADTIMDIHEPLFHSFIMIMDIYFLRRFLDKDYITNGIVYTGAFHSANYVKILTQEFGFRVTHVSYTSVSDMVELNAEILTRSRGDLADLFFPATKGNQCSDMTSFPKHFQ